MKVLMFLAAWLLPAAVFAADCSAITTTRTGSGYTVARLILADGKTSTAASTACAIPTRAGKPAGWDSMRCWAEASNSCTDFSAVLRDYPDANECNGTCDPQNLVTFAKGGTTSAGFDEVLGETYDVDLTIDTCTVSVVCDFYYKQ